MDILYRLQHINEFDSSKKALFFNQFIMKTGRRSGQRSSILNRIYINFYLTDDMETLRPQESEWTSLSNENTKDDQPKAKKL